MSVLGWEGCNCSGCLHYTAKAVILSVLIKPWGTICGGSRKKFGWEQERTFNVLIPSRNRNIQVLVFWDSSRRSAWLIMQRGRTEVYQCLQHFAGLCPFNASTLPHEKNLITASFYTVVLSQNALQFSRVVLWILEACHLEALNHYFPIHFSNSW